jgi:hypothetical protein
LYTQNDTGIVFLNGTSKDNYCWAAIKHRPLTEDEKQVYIKEGKEVPPHKSDSETFKNFPRLGFLEALNYIGMA